MMQVVLRIFSAIHAVIAMLFAVGGLLLAVIATWTGGTALANGLDSSAAQAVIEAIGLMATAVVSLQIAQTIAEEEVVRGAHVSAPTRVRRFLSRFFVVVIVALAIEGLVATFKALHESPESLARAATLVAATGILLAGWGAFIWLNRAAEELEPEAMEEAKKEDRKVDGGK
jgi:hypothetical protein